MDDKIKVKIIVGSTRQGRFGDKPANWLYEDMKKDGVMDVELLDLRDYPMPFFDDPTSPSMNTTGKYSNPVVQKWSDKIREADAFIIVTPEYNHGYPSVLKNALDSIYNEWVKKPVAFVGYGAVSGARSIEQLRGVVIELQMTPVRVSLGIPSDVYMAAMKNDPAAFEELKKGHAGDRLAGLKTQVLWWGKALKAARDADSSK